MDRLPRNLQEADFPGVVFDYMDIEGEGSHCLQCPFRLVREDEHTETDTANSSHSLSHQTCVTSRCDLSILMSTGNNQELQDESNESDDMTMSEGGVHPLLFPDVIKDVMNNLPAKDVESCRLVCRAWNTEASKVLRNKRVVVFVDADAVRVYNNAMRNTTVFPHAQFEFCMQDFTGLLDEDLREFWQIFGPQIKALEFRQSCMFWRDFYEVIEQKVPNLEKLSLKHLPRHVLRGRTPSTERHLIPSVKELRLASLPASINAANERLTDLLKSLPNLEVIKFLPIKQAVTRSKVCSTLLVVLQKPEISLRNLRRIDLNLELNTEGIETLTQKHFPLQTLHVTLNNGAKATSLKSLFCSLQSTLSELKISFPDTFSNYQTFLCLNNSMKPEESVQVLTKLKFLSMKNFKGSINFVQKMPALQKLQVTTPNLEHSVPFGFRRKLPSFGFNRSDLSVEHDLQSLKIVSSSKSVAETLTLDGISRCFPFLNCLHLHGVDDDGLGVIYRNLPFLSAVEFVEATCTDQGLTGIPLEICNDMVETSTFIVVQADRYRRDLFIGSLQFLRNFSITASKISDAAIALGLADCKNLKQLKIGSPMITDTGVIIITDKFFKQLDCLDVSECTEITEQSRFYAREKLIGKLKVAETQEMQGQTKLTVKQVSNIDREIVKTRRVSTGAIPFALNAAHSKFIAQDTDFFEEHSEDELRERGFGLIQLAAFPPERNRQRIIRIREALRRNADFMRTLQRLGLQRFRRLFRRELQEGLELRGVPDGDLEIQLARRRIRNLHPLDVEIEDIGIVVRNRNGQEDIERHPANLPHEQDADIQNINANNDVEQFPALHLADEDDGGPMLREIGPNRLPEFHLNEIVRLGLRLDDVEFWLRNHPYFEGNENDNPDGILARGLRAEAVLMGVHLNEEANGGAENLLAEEDVLDLEAFRRVVLNAFDEDIMRLQDVELPFVAQPPDAN